MVGLFLRLWTSLRPCRSSSSSPRCTFGWCLRSAHRQSASTSSMRRWRVPTVQTVEKTVEIPQVLFLGFRGRFCATTGSWSRLCRKLWSSRSCSTLTGWSMSLLGFLGVSSSRTRLLTWPLLCRQRPGRDSAENCRGSAVVAVSWTRWLTCPLCTSRVQTR